MLPRFVIDVPRAFCTEELGAARDFIVCTQSRGSQERDLKPLDESV
jgi:hypothetical protein